MTLQLILPGYCEIPLYEKIGGSNRYPETIIWSICGYTTVDSDNYQWLNQYRWLRQWNSCIQSYYVMRLEKLLNGKYVNIYMAREVLGLPRGAGHGKGEADHIDHNTFKNTRDNLRVATCAQSRINRRKHSNNSFRFKGVYSSESGFRAFIGYNYQRVCFKVMRIEAEAAFMYNHAAILFNSEFVCLNEIPEDEMPSEERQEWLKKLVVDKLIEVGLFLLVPM